MPIPIKGVFSGGVPVALGQFGAGEVVPLLYGGTGRIDGGATVFKNAIINGAMMVDQRNAGAAVTPTAGVLYLLDRMKTIITASSKLTFQQSTDAPPGLPASMKITVASSYSPAAADAILLEHNIEGLNSARFGFGQTWAKKICVSFWVKGSVAGTYPVALVNSGSARSYVGTYTIAVANTWEFKFVTLTADTSGTWATDTSVGVRVRFDLGSGSNFSTAAGAWAAGNFLRTAGTTTFVSQANGSTLFITGVQFEEGPLPTAYELLPFDVVMLRCQRYFEKSFAIGTAPASAVGVDTGEWRITAIQAGAVVLRAYQTFVVRKRIASAPVTIYNPVAAGSQARDQIAAADCTATSVAAYENALKFICTQPAGTAVGNPIIAHWTCDAEL